jgi:hypothetical protein
MTPKAFARAKEENSISLLELLLGFILSVPTHLLTLSHFCMHSQLTQPFAI